MFHVSARYFQFVPSWTATRSLFVGRRDDLGDGELHRLCVAALAQFQQGSKEAGTNGKVQKDIAKSQRNIAYDRLKPRGSSMD